MRLSLSTQHHNVLHSSSLCGSRRPLAVAAASKQQAKTGTKKGFGSQQQQHEQHQQSLPPISVQVAEVARVAAHSAGDPIAQEDIRVCLALPFSTKGPALSNVDLGRVQRIDPTTVPSIMFMEALQKLVAHPKCHMKSVEVLMGAALHPKRLSGGVLPEWLHALKWNTQGLRTSPQLIDVASVAVRLVHLVGEQLSKPQQQQQQQYNGQQLEPWTPGLAAQLLVLPLLEAVQQCIPESLSEADTTKLAAVPGGQLQDAIKAAGEGCDDRDAYMDCARCALAITVLMNLVKDSTLAKIKPLFESKDFRLPVVQKLVEVALSFPCGVPVDVTDALRAAAAVSAAEGDLQPVAWAEQLLQHTHHAVMWKAQHEVLTAAVAATAAAAVSASSSERQAWEQQLLQLWRQLLACMQRAEQYMSTQDLSEYQVAVPFSATILAAALAADGFLAMQVLQEPGLPVHLSAKLLGGAVMQYQDVTHPGQEEHGQWWLFPPLPEASAAVKVDRLVRLLNILLTHTQQQQLWPGLHPDVLHAAAQCADRGRWLVPLPSSTGSSTGGGQGQQAATATPTPATSATWHEQVLVHLLARRDAASCRPAAALLCGLAEDSADSSEDWQQLLAFLQEQLGMVPARTINVLQILLCSSDVTVTSVLPNQLWQLYQLGVQHSPTAGISYSWPPSKVLTALAPEFVAAPERLVQMWQQYSAGCQARAENLVPILQHHRQDKEKEQAAAVACALSQLDSSTKERILTALVSEGQLAEACRICECQAALWLSDAVAIDDDEDPGDVTDELLLLLATTVVDQQQQSGRQLLDSNALIRLLQLCVDRAADAAEAKTPVDAAVLLLQLWHEQQQQQRRAASSEAVHMPLTLAQQLVQQLCSRQQLAAAAQLLLHEVVDRAKGEQAGASLAAVVLAALRGLHQGGGSSSSGNTAAQAEQVLQQLLEQLPGHPGAAEASVAALLLVSEPKEVALLYHIARQVHHGAPVAPGLSLQQLGVVTTHVCQCMLAAAASGRSSIRSSSGSAGAGALQVSEQLWQLPCLQQLVADCLAAAGTAQHLPLALCVTLINALAAANTQLQPEVALHALGLQKQLGLGPLTGQNSSSSGGGGSNGGSSGSSGSTSGQKQQKVAKAAAVAADTLIVAELLSQLLFAVDLNAPQGSSTPLAMLTPAAAATAIAVAWLWSGECPAATAAVHEASTGKAAPQWPSDPTALWQLCQQLLFGPGRKAGQSNDHELLSLLVGRLQLAAVLQAGEQQQAMQLARDTPGLLLPLAEHWQRQQLLLELADAAQLLQLCVAAGTAQAAAAAELLLQLLGSQKGATGPAAVPSELLLQLVQVLSVHGKIAAAQQQLAKVLKQEPPPAAAAVVPAVTALAAGAATAGEEAAVGVLQLLVSAPNAQQLLVAALDVATGKTSNKGAAALLLHALQHCCKQKQEQQQWPALLSSQQLERLCGMVADTAAATGARPSAGLTALPSGPQLAADLLAASKSHTSSSSGSLQALTLTPAMVTHLLNALAVSQPVLVPANAAAALGLLRLDSAARAGEGLPRQSNDSADSSSGSGSVSAEAAAAAVSTRVVAELCYSLLQAAGCKDEPSAAAEWALEWTEQQQPQLTPEAAAAAMFASWLWAQHADTVARQQARAAITAALESGSSRSAGWDSSRDGVSLAAVAQAVGAQQNGPGFGLRHSVAAVGLQLYKHVRSKAGRPNTDSLLYDLGLLAAAAAGQWEEGGNIISAAERAATEYAAADRQQAAGARSKAATTAAAATPGGSWVPLFTPAYAALAEVQVRELGMQKASEWLLTCLSARPAAQQEPKQAAAGKKGRETATPPAAATSAAAAGVSAEEQVVVLNAFLSAAAEVVSCAQAEGADEAAHEAATAAVAAARSLLLVDIVAVQEAASRAKLPAAAAGAGGSMAVPPPDCLRADRFTWSHLIPLLAAAGQYKLFADIVLAAATKQLPGLEAARTNKQYALRLQHLLAAAAAAFNAAGAPEAAIALCDALAAAGGRQITVSGFAEQLLEASASNEQGLLSYLEEEDDVLERLLVLSDGDTSSREQERSLAVWLRERSPAAALAALQKQLSEVVKQL